MAKKSVLPVLFAVLAAVGYNVRRLLNWRRLWLSAVWIILAAVAQPAQAGTIR